MSKQEPLSEALVLESLQVGAHPLVEPLIERLRLREFLQQAFSAPEPRIKLAPLDSALVLVRNFTLCRHPLYEVPEWVRGRVPTQLGLEPEQVGLINDDRLGRTLDKLFLADRRSIVTRLIVSMAKTFGLDLQRLHNDSTSITFSGVYSARPPRKDGRRCVRITHGHNKDHRPDLKQLVWSLTVTRDGAVPVHYNVFDGNVTDDQTHIEIWKALREVVGGPDFVYVADAKLCTRENMGFIHGQGGRFITVLPRSRKEDARFKRSLLDHAPDWQLIWERPALRRTSDPPERFEAVEDPEPSAEGYRIVWYRSSEKWRRDERVRENAVHEARWALHRLAERVGRGKLKTREQVQQAVEKILEDSAARAWVQVELLPRERHTYKQGAPGRPGKNTHYVRQTIVVYQPVTTLDTQSIEASSATDGIFPLITNSPADQLSPLDLLTTYKYQAFVEKRHEQLKTAAEVVPVNYKTPERIEAFLFLYFTATILHALLERQVREAMRARGIRSIPLYPEERACRAPTADKLLGLFENLRRHRLFHNAQPVKTFWDELTDVQRLVLDLLGISTAAYGQ
jgi:transposase